MFINTSGNARHGDTFVLVHKHGIEYHIYGSGENREVVAMKSRDNDDDDQYSQRHGAPKRAAASSGGILTEPPITPLRHESRRPRPEADAPRAVAGDQVQSLDARDRPEQRPAVGRQRPGARAYVLDRRAA